MNTLMTPQDATASILAAEPNTNDILVTAQGFSELNLSDNVLKALSDMNFTTPSSIQKEAIPQVMAGTDIIAKAPTGSGKTAAFAIPIIEKLDFSPENKSVQALVLCPTRELAIQVHKEFEKLTKYFENVAVVSVYGGQGIDRQLTALKRQPQIIVATPGRLMDHLRRGSIKLNFINTVVLDEADEMLDMGFRDDIHTILEDTSVERQTILFSATMAKNIMELTKKFQKSPNIVDVMDSVLDIPNIEQQYYEVVEKQKPELLIRLLSLHNVRLALVFCNTKSNVDRIVEILKTKGYFADSLHGDMNQAQREKVMRGFRSGSVEILVATDVAGRGIDVKDIEAVFNYDLPRDDEDYIHRIGRTGRAGTSGIALTFVSKNQVQNIRRIERANGVLINKKENPTAEEIETARESGFEIKVKEIIKNEDLSHYKAKVEAMLSDEISLIDVAATLFKLSSTKSAKKINSNMVFEAAVDEDNDRQRRRGSRAGSRHGGGFGGGRDRNRDGNRSGSRDGGRERSGFGSRDFSKPRSEGAGRDFSKPRSENAERNFSKPKTEGSSDRDFSQPKNENKRGENSPKKREYSRSNGAGFKKNKSSESPSLDTMINAVKGLDSAVKKKPFNSKFKSAFGSKPRGKKY